MGRGGLGKWDGTSPCNGAGRADIDAALLDVNLRGQDTFGVADILSERHIPFVFATVYGADGVADCFRGVPTPTKPGIAGFAGQAEPARLLKSSFRLDACYRLAPGAFGSRTSILQNRSYRIDVRQSGQL